MIEVDCSFLANGRIRVRQVRQDGLVLATETGRQWQDETGRHILVMINGRVHTLTLLAETLQWNLTPQQTKGTL